MHRVSNEIELAASPAAVWALITDLNHYGDWNLTHVAFPDGPPPLREAGTFREVVTILGIRREARWTVVGLDPGRLVELRGRGPLGIRLMTSLRLAATANGGTRFTYEATFDGGPLRGPLGAAVTAEADRTAATSLERLGSLLTHICNPSCRCNPHDGRV